MWNLVENKKEKNEKEKLQQIVPFLTQKQNPQLRGVCTQNLNPRYYFQQCSHLLNLEEKISDFS